MTLRQLLNTKTRYLSYVPRRLALLSLSLGLTALAGCLSDQDLAPTDRESTRSTAAPLASQSVTFVVLDTADIASDGYDFSSSAEKKEHCYVSAALQSDLPAGTQVRISTGTHLGLCTVMHNTSATPGPTCPGGITPCYRVGVHAQLATNRLGAGASPSIGTTISGAVSNEASVGTIGVAVHQSWPSSFSAVQPSNDIHEYVDAPSTAVVAYTAPHGRLETNVAQQVDYIIEDADADNRNAGWVAQYGTGAGGHFNHFHITSDDLSEDSFPDLDTLFGLTSLRYAVSFHGFDEGSYTFDDAPDYTHVLVGGDEDLSFRRGVAELLNEVLPSDKLASAEYNGEPLWAENDDNFVNRLAEGGLGLQLEQSGAIRTSYAETVANTVQSVYDCLIDGPDVPRVTSPDVSTSSKLVTSASTGYATSGRCPRFIAEVQTSLQVTSFNAGISSCSGAGSAHVDYYRWDTTLTRWRRIGGGRIDYNSSCTATKASSFEEPSSTNRAAGVFRAVIRATNSSNVAQNAFFQQAN